MLIMKFEQYIECQFSLHEAVIEPTTTGFIDNLKSIKDSWQSPDTTEELLDDINYYFNEHDITFVIKKSKFLATTNKNGKITINVNNNFIDIWNNNFDRFIDNLKIVLNHELIHREQSNRINWKNFVFKPSKDKTKIEYFGDKHEIMSYAKTITDRLYRKYYSTKNVLKFLRNPVRNVNNFYDDYIDMFGKDHKVIKKLYKYMYEYMIKGNN